MNALNKSFLDCILEVKKKNRAGKVGDKNGNEHSFGCERRTTATMNFTTASLLSIRMTWI